MQDQPITSPDEGDYDYDPDEVDEQEQEGETDNGDDDEEEDAETGEGEQDEDDEGPEDSKGPEQRQQVTHRDDRHHRPGQRGCPTKQGLRVPQVRILQALADAGGPLTRAEIATRAKVSPSMTGNLGPVESHPDLTDRRYGKRCLIGLRYVTVEVHEVKGGTTTAYRISRMGLKALAEHLQRREEGQRKY